MLEDVERMRKKGLKMIKAKEFDEKFDRGEDIDEYLDLENPLLLDDLVSENITITLSKDLKDRLLEFSKKLNLSFEDTIKAILAKEVGLI